MKEVLKVDEKESPGAGNNNLVKFTPSLANHADDWGTRTRR